jgi:hypothetical protein
VERLQDHAIAAVEQQLFAGRANRDGTPLHARATRWKGRQNGLEVRDREASDSGETTCRAGTRSLRLGCGLGCCGGGGRQGRRGRWRGDRAGRHQLHRRSGGGGIRPVFVRHYGAGQHGIRIGGGFRNLRLRPAPS